MSIDARISAVMVIASDHCTTCDSTGVDPESSWDVCPACHGGTKESPVVVIKLEPSSSDRIAGQTTMLWVDPPSLDVQQLSSVIGTFVWGNSSCLMVGDTKWADRIGCTRFRLVTQENRR